MKAPFFALLLAVASGVAAQGPAAVPVPSEFTVWTDLGQELTADPSPGPSGGPPIDKILTVFTLGDLTGPLPGGPTPFPRPKTDDGDTGGPVVVGMPPPGETPRIGAGQPNNVAPGNKVLAAGNVPLPPMPPARTGKPANATTPHKPDADEGPSKPAILGAIAGAFAVLIIIVICLVWFIRRRKQNKLAEEKKEDGEEGDEEKDEDGEEAQQGQDEEQAQAPVPETPSAAVANDPEAIQPYTVPIYEHYTQPTVAQQIDPYGDYATYSSYPYTSRV